MLCNTTTETANSVQKKSVQHFFVRSEPKIGLGGLQFKGAHWGKNLNYVQKF